MPTVALTLLAIHVLTCLLLLLGLQWLCRRLSFRLYPCAVGRFQLEVDISRPLNWTMITKDNICNAAIKLSGKSDIEIDF